MKKETILSIFLSLLILGSIVGMYYGGTANNEDDYNEPEPQEQDIDNYLGEIDGKITSTIPEVIVVSKTEFFETSQIEKDLLEIEGVKKASVEYNKQNEDEIIVILRINIEEEKINSIISQINQFEYLLSDPIEFYKQGILDLNDKIVLNSATDENKTIEYEFIDYRAEGIIGIETLKDDIVSGQLQATFYGTEPYGIVFFETSNVTAAPKLLNEEISLEVFEWKEDYLYKGEGNYFEDIEKEIILEKTEILVEENIEIEKNPVLAYKNEDLKEISIEDFDLNYFLNIEKLEEEMMILFDENISFEEYGVAKELLEEKGFLKEDITKEITTNYYITTENLLHEEMIDSLEEINIKITEVNKNAVFDLEEIEIDSNIYNYPEKYHEKWLLYPEYTEKEIIDFNMQAYVSRNEIMFLFLETN